MDDEVNKNRRLRKPESVRQRAEKSLENNPRRLQKTAHIVKSPFKKATSLGKKEYYLSVPDNKYGKFINKRRSIIPRFLINAWKELKDVSWPNRKESRQLTIAVFMFSIVFGALIAITDFGLDKLFRKVFLK
ncbi:MAG: hypothetical protein NVSMB46_01400 [Candidatus Saccharimonadales bacterium]